jgi:hypothetical protein
MPRSLVKVEGARELRATLKAAGDSFADLKAANAAAAGIVAPVAAGRAPVRTGRLAATVRPAGTKVAAIIRAGRAAVPYAGPIEFGWPSRNIEPQGFIVPAARDTEPQWTEVYWAAINRIIARIRGTS